MEYNFDFLNTVYNILIKYKEEEKKTGNTISILKISGKDHDEVVICRLIAFLLNPKEQHYQNTKFLNLFLEEIGESIIQIDEKFEVITEFPTDKGRRIDIVLKSNKRFIPFEVKIYANDQKEQCVHYYNFSHQNFNAEKVFYLTPYEHTPDNSSTGDLKIGKTLKLITFREQILNWLDKCEKDDTNYTPLLIEFIRELKLAIRRFCGLVENKEMNDELLKEIMKTEQTIEAAKAIYSIGQEIKPILLWENFCKEIQNDNLLSDEPEYGNEMLRVFANYIDIYFVDIFSYIEITSSSSNIDDTQKKQLFEKLYNVLINQGYECTKVEQNGFTINNTRTKFLDTQNPFELYKTFTNQDEKNKLIKKMQDFSDLVYNICK